MKYSLIIPAKNEEKRIQLFLLELARYIQDNKLDTETEVIVVVNNSTDKTFDIAKTFAKTYEFFNVVNIPFYTGKGGAVTAGFKVADGDIIGFADADGSSAPAEIFRIFKELDAKNYLDGVIASRYMPGAVITESQSKLRKLFGGLFRLITVNALDIKYIDTQCGLKAFRKNVAKTFAERITTVGWTFDVNLLMVAKALGYRIEETPTDWEDKANSQFKIGPAILSVSKELVELIRLRLTMNKENSKTNKMRFFYHD